MRIDYRNLLRGMGGSACAGATVLAMASLLGGFSSYAPVSAASTSNNKGDIWIDISGSTDGPEMDPHLSCDTGTLWIWGMKLNDAGGPVAIQGWPPSGGGASDEDWSDTWHFDTTQGGQQVIAEVDVATLIANAQANGDTAHPIQGFHFKIDLEDPRTGHSMGDDKYKTFWVNCAASTPTPTGTVSGTATPGTPTPTLSTESPTPTLSTGTPTPSGGVGGATATPSPTSSVQGITTTPTPASNVAGIATPNTGAGPGGGNSLPLEVSGGLMLAGLGMLAGGRRMKRRSTR